MKECCFPSVARAERRLYGLSMKCLNGLPNRARAVIISYYRRLTDVWSRGFKSSGHVAQQSACDAAGVLRQSAMREYQLFRNGFHSQPADIIGNCIYSGVVVDCGGILFHANPGRPAFTSVVGRGAIAWRGCGNFGGHKLSGVRLRD